jgi:serine/threonine-protein kinase
MTEQLDRLCDALAERYAIERELGRGGMATVYLADDLRHGRKVAIKVLLPEVAASLGHERFIREIEIAARLQHPHVLPVYDSGDAGGILYYVMPYVDGESLAQFIERHGAIPHETAMRIVEEVASALDYAHRQGIVHRDIKPANILLSDGHAVVADFGIARAITAAAGEQLTQVGLAVGTPAYMSPEQALGEADLDGRTDVYALGCVAYEMLTGVAPYTGGTPQSIIAKVVTGSRPKLTAVPGSIRHVVDRAMAGERDDRFDSAADLAAALGATVATPSRRKWMSVVALAVVATVIATLGVSLTMLRGSGDGLQVASEASIIAVLPFATTGPDVGLLGEGMVDLLSTNLSGVGGISTVDPRLVLKQWEEESDGEALSVEQSLAIGKALGAGSVLVGSVVEAGPRVRVRAQLYSSAGEALGGTTVDGPVSDMLAIVDTMSVRLLSEIWRSSAELPDVRVSAITSGSLDAVRSYLTAAQAARRADWDTAIPAFRDAVETDSTFALAHMLLADAYWWVDGPASSRGQEHLNAAVRHRDRLPPRELRLAGAAQAFAVDPPTGVDSMRAFVAVYPQDVFGWMVLGEVQYHTNHVLNLPVDSLRAPFERAAGLDSTYVPAYFHTVEMAFDGADTTLLYRDLRILEQQRAYAYHTRRYRLASQIVWGLADSVEARTTQLLAEWPDVVLRSGGVLERHGDRERAAVVYRRALGASSAEADTEWRRAIEQRLAALDAAT